MINKSFVMKLFEGFFIRRWNDQIRPIELVEMDKNAHKMVIAYCLTQYEEDDGKNVDWHNIIRGGIYELLRRIVTSDIKSPVYRKIREDEPTVFAQLNEWVYNQFKSLITNKSIKDEFRKYLIGDGLIDPISKKILKAAHLYASFWEFQIIRNANPHGYKIQEIDKMMYKDFEPYMDLIGLRKLLCKGKISSFIDIVGQLRFQVRWSQTPRVPTTSVLGHSMMVAVLAYLFSRKISACEKRIRNNFFGGLFHDLPEALTRDIISPVKGSNKELSDVIGKIETELVEKEIFPLLPNDWRSDLKYFTENEFENKVRIDGEELEKPPTSEEINSDYNEDIYYPYDGQIIKACDRLATYTEAFASIETGIKTSHLFKCEDIKNEYKDKRIAGIDFGSIYADF